MTDTPNETNDALFAARKQWDAATGKGLDVVAALKAALEWMPLMFDSIEELRKELDGAKNLIQAMEIERGQMARAMERLGQEAQVAEFKEALRLASIRLGICADRMRGCNAEGGKHGLIDEVDDFAREAAFMLKEDGK